jgi:hypothetical protein
MSVKWLNFPKLVAEQFAHVAEKRLDEMYDAQTAVTETTTFEW